MFLRQYQNNLRAPKGLILSVIIKNNNSNTLWFSVLQFRQHVRIDKLYVRAKKISALRGRDGQKSLALLGLKAYTSHNNLHFKLDCILQNVFES